MPVQNNSTTPVPPRQRFPTPEERYGPDVEWVRLHDYQDPPEIGLFIVEISYTPQTGAFGVRVLGHPPGNYTKPPTLPLPTIFKEHLRQMAHDGQTARHALGLRVNLSRESREAWAAAMTAATEAVRPVWKGALDDNTSRGHRRRALKKGLRPKKGG